MAKFKFIIRLRSLVREGYLVHNNVNDSWYMTKSGRAKGAYILKLHCLWEAYLTKYLRLNPNAIHEEAESIEHILTPELERDLLSLMPDLPVTLYDKNPGKNSKSKSIFETK